MLIFTSSLSKSILVVMTPYPSCHAEKLELILDKYVLNENEAGPQPDEPIWPRHSGRRLPPRYRRTGDQPRSVDSPVSAPQSLPGNSRRNSSRADFHHQATDESLTLREILNERRIDLVQAIAERIVAAEAVSQTAISL